MTRDRLLARVTLPADPASVPALQLFMMQAASAWVASAQELPALGELVEEVALHVIRTAFDPGEEMATVRDLAARYFEARKVSSRSQQSATLDEGKVAATVLPKFGDVAAASLVLFALLAGMAGMTWGLI